jgi:hypothetical protein
VHSFADIHLVDLFNSKLSIFNKFRMKQQLLFVTAMSSMSLFAQDCNELFISEYVEGWSNNKALEIYNPTNSSIDLSQYMVIRYSNGSANADATDAVQLTGTIGPKDVHVGVLDKQDPLGTGQESPVWDELADKADAFYCPVYNTTNAFYWNGNDAVVLAKGTVNNIGGAILVDVFGKIGEDPGVGWSTAFPYTGAGEIVTADHSMIRKPGILKGVTNPVISFFDPLLQWDSIPPVVIDEVSGFLVGNWFSLGEHDCDCNSLSVETIEDSKPEVTVFPNPSNGSFVLGNVGEFDRIEIRNSLGQLVHKIEQPTNIVNVSLDARKGVYFVNLLDSAGGQTTRRLIIK